MKYQKDMIKKAIELFFKKFGTDIAKQKYCKKYLSELLSSGNTLIAKNKAKELLNNEKIKEIEDTQDYRDFLKRIESGNIEYSDTEKKKKAFEIWHIYTLANQILLTNAEINLILSGDTELYQKRIKSINKLMHYNIEDLRLYADGIYIPVWQRITETVNQIASGTYNGLMVVWKTGKAVVVATGKVAKGIGNLGSNLVFVAIAGAGIYFYVNRKKRKNV